MATLVNIIFRSMSIGHPIPEIWLFQTLTLKLQGKGHRCGQRMRSYSRHSILLIRFLFISHQTDQQFLMQLFRNLTLKHPRSRSWVRSRVKVTNHTQYPSNQCTSFLFHINWTKYSRDMAKIVFDLEKTHSKFLKIIGQNNRQFPQELLQNLIR